MTLGTQILALGHALPDLRISNQILEDRLELEPGWIFQRTGIEERRYARDDEALSDLAIAAAEAAFADGGVARTDVDLVILATSTPDHPLPPSAPFIAHRLGLKRAGAIDLAGACSGFLYALHFADAHVRRTGQTVLVIAANILSRRTNPTDRSSVILFGDGAGAVVLGPNDDPQRGVVSADFDSDGEAYDLIKIAMGGSRYPYDPNSAADMMFMKIADGQKVFAKAVSMMADTASRALKETGLKISDIDAFVPHQANQRMIDATAKKLGVAPEKVATSIKEFGNSSAATIPITLSHTGLLNHLPANGTVLMCAAGAGLTGGAILLRL